MRIGSNPEKFNNQLRIGNYHRIVIPVFIPNFEGYFKDSFQIFKYCLESLLLTIHPKTRITIYNNDCHQEIKDYINEQFEKSEFIDQVFHSKVNLGKINAILAAVKGNLEPLITITDSDVLFKNGWQEAVEEKFVNFPEAGMVSPVPLSNKFKNYTNCNWFYGFVKGKIRFENVIDPDAMVRFNKSLGSEIPPLKKMYLEKYLVLKNKTDKAVMGCGHFVATLRREVFDKGSNEPAFVKIQSGVEGKFIDSPNEKLGYLRIATLKNYAFHLGNTTEEWMVKEFNLLPKKSEAISRDDDGLYYGKSLSYIKIFIGKIIKKIVLIKFIKASYFKSIGLSKGENY